MCFWVPTSPTHCFDYRKKPPPGGDKGNGSSGGEENQVPYPALKSRLVLSSSILHPHSAHFWFEPDSCFWSARTPYHREEMSALHFTRCERWKVEEKTPSSPYDSLKRKQKKKKKWGKKKKPSWKEQKQIPKINKSTIGSCSWKRKHCGKNCSGEIWNCGCINNLATWDTVFLFTIRFDVAERRDQIRKSFLLLIPPLHGSHLVLHWQPPPKQRTTIPLAG